MEVTGEALAAMLGSVLPHLDERQRRLLLGAQARALGHGGVRAVARAAGVREATVSAGAAEVDAGAEPLGRVRQPGGGRKRAAVLDPGLVPALLALVEPDERGDPMSPLRWTTKSTRKLAAELTAQGHTVGADTAGDLLRAAGFSLQGTSRVIEGKQSPDRDAQFRYINGQVKEHLAAAEPVISVDAKKKEQVGQYGQGGQEWRPKGSPVPVKDHDFPDPVLGKAVPYGIYDLAANAGWVNVGTDHDTAAFAAESIRRWWHGAGRDAYPSAGRLLITADAGGSNSYRTRAWKTGIAALAAEAGLEITVCHFPPGTSKWNKIEHRLFSYITMNWRGRPLTSHQVIVNTIAATTTGAGLTVRAELDPGSYPEGVKIPAAQMNALPITRHHWHGDWNYTLASRPLPGPAAPAPPPRPRRPRASHDTLSHPALTGLPRPELGNLITTLAIPWNALQEQHRYQARRGPRRTTPRTTSHHHLDLTDQTLAALITGHLGLPATLLEPLLGARPSTISYAIRDIRHLLPPPRTPPATRIRTLTELITHATNAGITLPAHITSNTPAT